VGTLSAWALCSDLAANGDFDERTGCNQAIDAQAIDSSPVRVSARIRRHRLGV
jgi:hypothetical protein